LLPGKQSLVVEQKPPNRQILRDPMSIVGQKVVGCIEDGLRDGDKLVGAEVGGPVGTVLGFEDGALLGKTEGVKVVGLVDGDNDVGFAEGLVVDGLVVGPFVERTEGIKVDGLAEDTMLFEGTEEGDLDFIGKPVGFVQI